MRLGRTGALALGLGGLLLLGPRVQAQPAQDEAPSAPVLRGPKSGPPKLDVGTVKVPLVYFGIALLLLTLLLTRAQPAHH
ncbi:MAG: hypothetical protein ACYC8T_22175 [Myxococcaceae bacterium]